MAEPATSSPSGGQPKADSGALSRRRFEPSAQYPALGSSLRASRERLLQTLWIRLGVFGVLSLLLPSAWLLFRAPGVASAIATTIGLLLAWVLARFIATGLASQLADVDDLKVSFAESERLRIELEKSIRSREAQAEHLRVALEESERLRRELEEVIENREDEIRDRTEELQVANLNLEKIAREDGLTGIANHRRFVEFADQCWRIAIREQKPIGLLMVDVDHFKAFNDIYGHQAGDQCLRKVARELEVVARRPLDLAARYGGEEFAVLLYGTNLSDALDLAEACRRGVERLQIPHSGSVDWGVVTISIGVASVTPQVDTDGTLLINLADKALYRAKKNGRNRFDR
jgi:diguanylate cyclase (GGDEF)-like protein